MWDRWSIIVARWLANYKTVSNNHCFQKLKTLQAGVGEFTAALKAPEQKMLTAKQIQGDMPLLDRVKTEIAIAAKNVSIQI